MFLVLDSPSVETRQHDQERRAESSWCSSPKLTGNWARLAPVGEGLVNDADDHGILCLVEAIVAPTLQCSSRRYRSPVGALLPSCPWALKLAPVPDDEGIWGHQGITCTSCRSDLYGSDLAGITC